MESKEGAKSKEEPEIKKIPVTHLYSQTITGGEPMTDVFDLSNCYVDVFSR